MTNEDKSSLPDRASVWSVRAGWQAAYFIIFTALNIAGLSLVCWYEIASHTEDDAVRTILNIVGGEAQVAVGAAAITITIMEVASYTMVAARYFERWLEDRRNKRDERLRAEVRIEVRAEARIEVRAEVRIAMTEWNQRRLDAEARGEPFNEPLPDFASPEENGSQPD